MLVMRKSFAIIALFAACGGHPALAQEAGEGQGVATPEAAPESSPVRATTRPNFFNRDPNGPQITNWKETRPTQADYPAQSWLDGEEGAVRYEIAVDAAGQATKCMILESSGHAALDKRTCDIVMERARFTPAQNEADEAIDGVHPGSHRWRKRELEVPGNFRFAATFILDEKGRTRDCELQTLDGDMPRNLEEMARKNACPFGARSSTAPYRDANGLPMAKRVTVEFTAQVSDVEPKSED